MYVLYIDTCVGTLCDHGWNMLKLLFQLKKDKEILDLQLFETADGIEWYDTPFLTNPGSSRMAAGDTCHLDWGQLRKFQHLYGRKLQEL